MLVERVPLLKIFWTIYLKPRLQILICRLWIKLLTNLLPKIKLMIISKLLRNPKTEILFNSFMKHRLYLMTGLDCSPTTPQLVDEKELGILVIATIPTLKRPQACNFIKKETLAQVFSCEFCEISKNTSGGCFLWYMCSKRRFQFLSSKMYKGVSKC